MDLKEIKSEDLIFSDDKGRTSTQLVLDDYDWMNYVLTTKFITKEQGLLKVKFEYFGFLNSTMEVEQFLNEKTETVTYVYSTDIFQKYIIKFLEKHIASWSANKYAFNGEEEVIAFFNEVLAKGKINSK